MITAEEVRNFEREAQVMIRGSARHLAEVNAAFQNGYERGLEEKSESTALFIGIGIGAVGLVMLQWTWATVAAWLH